MADIEMVAATAVKEEEPNPVVDTSPADKDITRRTEWSYHVHNGRRTTCIKAHPAGRRTCWTRTLWIRPPPYLSAKVWLRYKYSFEDVCETLECYQSYDLWHLALELGGTLSNQAVKQSFATTDYASIGSMHNTCGGRATVLERDIAEIAKGYPNHGGPSVLRKNRVRSGTAVSHHHRHGQQQASPWTLASMRDISKKAVPSSLSMTTVPPLKLKFTPPDLPIVPVDAMTFQSYERQIKTEQKEFDLTVPDTWAKTLTSAERLQVNKSVPSSIRLLLQMIRTTPALQFKDISVVPICRDGNTGYLLMRRVITEEVLQFHYGKPYCMFFQPIRALIGGVLHALHLEQFWVYCPEMDSSVVPPALSVVTPSAAIKSESAPGGQELLSSLLARQGFLQLQQQVNPTNSVVDDTDSKEQTAVLLKEEEEKTVVEEVPTAPKKRATKRKQPGTTIAAGRGGGGAKRGRKPKARALAAVAQDLTTTTPICSLLDSLPVLPPSAAVAAVVPLPSPIEPLTPADAAAVVPSGVEASAPETPPPPPPKKRKAKASATKKPAKAKAKSEKKEGGSGAVAVKRPKTKTNTQIKAEQTSRARKVRKASKKAAAIAASASTDSSKMDADSLFNQGWQFSSGNHDPNWFTSGAVLSDAIF